MVAVELAFYQQLGVIPLAEHLVAADSDGVREVEGARFIDHRDADAAVGIAHQHVLGDAARFLAENDIGAVRVAYVAVLVTRFGGKEEVFTALGLCEEIVDAVIVGDVDEVPVIESRAFEVAVGDLEAEGSHEVESSARSGTGARDIAGVLRDLRLEQHDVQNFVVRFFQFEFPLLSWNIETVFAETNLTKEVESCRKQ